jgi:hypothetical protein
MSWQRVSSTCKHYGKHYNSTATVYYMPMSH